MLLEFILVKKEREGGRNEMSTSLPKDFAPATLYAVSWLQLFCGKRENRSKRIPNFGRFAGIYRWIYVTPMSVLPL